jgi:SMODS-associated NUDIX domain
MNRRLEAPPPPLVLTATSRVNFPASVYSPPSQEVRVAMSALIRIAIGDQYILVRNLHRPENFSPFGGVYKYFRDTQIKLDSLDFRPQALDADMVSDLRGFLPYEQLDEFLNWFRQGQGRETADQCLYRELHEEAAQIGIEIQSDELTGIRFAHVRTIQEGPEIVPGESYVQYRIFDVYDLVPETARGQDLARRIWDHAVCSQDMISASAQEIKRGRDRSGHLIGSTAPYLFGHQRYRASDPIFVGG